MSGSLQLGSVKEQVTRKLGTQSRTTGKKSKEKTIGLKGLARVPVQDFGTPEVLVVLPYPGQADTQTRRAMSSQGMLWLHGALQQLGYGYRVTYAAPYYFKGKTQEYRLPSASEVNKCRDWFLGLEVNKFKAVLAVGSVAYDAVVGDMISKAGIELPSKLKPDQAGHIIRLLSGTAVIPIDNPEEVLWGKGTPETLATSTDKTVQAWRTNVSMLNFVLKDEADPFTSVLVSDANIDVALRTLSLEEYWVIDVETSDLDTLNCQVFSTAVSGMAGDIFWFTSMEHILRLQEVSADKILVMQNGMFDYDVLFNKGLSFKGNVILDTMLLGSVLDGTRSVSPSLSLKTLVAIYPKYTYRYLIKDMTNLSLFPQELLCKYNCEDVHATRLLLQYFLDYLLTEQQLRFSKDIHSSAIKVLSEIQRWGIPLNLEELAKLTVATKEELAVNAKICSTMLREQFQVSADMNTGSGKQLGDFLDTQITLLLAEELVNKLVSFRARNKTKSGALSTAKDTLLDLIRILKPMQSSRAAFLVQWLVAVLAVKKSTTVLSTFLEGFNRHVTTGSRVRASYNLTGARTGRLSSSNPNLQNVPIKLRKLFQPTEGYIFINADLSQIELRVAASLAPDLIMQEAYGRGEDIHALTAATVAGIPLDQVDADLRQKAKSVNFGFLYGMVAKSFKGYALSQYGAKFTDDEAIQARDAFFSKYPGLRTWHDETKRVVREKTFVTSPFGRVYYLAKYIEANGLESAVRKGLNYPVQGSGSDLTVWIMGQTFEAKEKRNLDCRFIGTVHDSMLLEVKEEIVDEVVQIIKDVTASAYDTFEWLKAPLEIDVEIAKYWK